MTSHEWPSRLVSPLIRALAGFAWISASPAFTGEDMPQETMMRQLQVNGVDLSYIEQGTGAPVIFVHGAWMDLRYWEPQRQAIATQYRFMAYSRRYHGTAPWPDQGEHYSLATDVADLVAFIRQLNAGPVHLVGLSSGGRIALQVTLQSPDLVRSLTLAEPPLGALLADKAVREEEWKMLESVSTAVKAGHTVQAVKLFFDWANNQGPGAFDTQPEALRQMILDNARTLLLTFSASTPRPPAISCATLGGVKMPTLIVGGERSQRFLVLINEILAQCIPGSRRVVIPKAAHLMNYENPAAFNEALLAFLTQQ